MLMARRISSIAMLYNVWGFRSLILAVHVGSCTQVQVESLIPISVVPRHDSLHLLAQLTAREVVRREAQRLCRCVHRCPLTLADADAAQPAHERRRAAYAQPKAARRWNEVSRQRHIRRDDEARIATFARRESQADASVACAQPLRRQSGGSAASPSHVLCEHS